MTDASATLQKEFDASPASTRDDPRKCGGCARGETETRSLTSEEPGPSRRVREERSRKSLPKSARGRDPAITAATAPRVVTIDASTQCACRPTAARPLSCLDTRGHARPQHDRSRHAWTRRSGRQRVGAVGGGVAHPSQRRPLRDVSVWFRLTFSILPLMLSEISSPMGCHGRERHGREVPARRGAQETTSRLASSAHRGKTARGRPRRAAAHLLSRCAARRDALALLTSHTCSGSGGGSRCVRCR